MRSLRARLLVCTTVGTAVVVVAAGVALYALVRGGVLGQFDAAMTDKAATLASVIEIENGKLDIGFDDLDMGEFAAGHIAAYLQVWAADGAVVFRSPSLGEDDLGPAAPHDGEQAACEVRLPDGRPGRSMHIAFTPRTESKDEAGGTDGPVLRIAIARGTAQVDALLARLRILLAAVAVAAVGVSAGVLWTAVGRGLRPVDRLARQIAALDESALARRIDCESAPAELVPVIECLNRLLGRLEAAFERERAFTADVAHELRTPLAGLRSVMEVATSRPRQAAEYAETIGQCLRMGVQLQRMVEHLLALCRLDAGQMEMLPEPVCLAAAVRDAWQPLAVQAAARNLRVDWRTDEEVSIETDASLLGLVLRNVLENAVVHADEGGQITVEAAADPGGACVRIRNSGSQVPPEQAEAVFDRFWRGSTARTEAAVHSGLGLALVRQAVAAMGGRARVRTVVGGDFEMQINLPDMVMAHDTGAAAQPDA